MKPGDKVRVIKSRVESVVVSTTPAGSQSVPDGMVPWPMGSVSLANGTQYWDFEIEPLEQETKT